MGDRRILAGTLLVFLSSCGGVSPNWPIDIDGPGSVQDVKRFEATAVEQGFVRVENRLGTVDSQDGPLKTLETWRLSGHASTYVALDLVVRENRYRIWFGDVDVDGPDFHGPSCTYYLKFIAALKQEFGAQQYRLKFISENCNHRGYEH